MGIVLKLDYDIKFEEFDVNGLRDKVDFVRMQTGLKATRVNIAMSRHGNTHVKIFYPDELPDLAMVALQAIYGSDWKRELHNLTRVLCGQRNWNILFEEPVKP